MSAYLIVATGQTALRPHLGHRGSRCCCPKAAIARDDIRAAVRVIDFNSDKADAELRPSDGVLDEALVGFLFHW
ncbi:hypothetical protein [Rhizobium giardinii]|uniref:hypothetical protein n=1 Tax=Rhizobium giardinii TaxID=56731 RepID=UPI003D6E9C3B